MRAAPNKRVVFAEAEEEIVLRAAIQFRDFGYGTPVLVGRTQAVLDKLIELGVDELSVRPGMVAEIKQAVRAV